MKLLVVILNYKTADLTLRTLDAVVAQLDQVGGASQAWVVDNCSPDDSVAVLRAGLAARSYGERVRLLESPRNGGYGAGNNLAFREASKLADPPTYYHVLNPDATPDPGTLRCLVEFMDANPRVGIAGGLLRYPDGRLQCSTFRFPSLLSEVDSYLRLGFVTRLLREHTLYMDPPPPTSRPVDWVSGASFVVRREALDRAGMFDETFFLYFEEIDLCRRVRAAGYSIHFVVDATVCHVNAVSTGMTLPQQRMPEYWFASRRHYLRKFHGAVGLAAFNVVALMCLALQRTRQAIGGTAVDTPFFLRDFVRFNFFGRRAGIDH
ncbi:glycosyltransferase family 2 protein [Ideonella sp.]|uniref:glycosyltransferase family 2 protein n=1 Tax=Ideonella sp. TaxID=1929293 RepID=UPI002B465033|nr:glycosyltransferase family 2 protein [Ideonella sp.]HJV70885.1 glycosyltransferase family 2 protein [Ideonella sp.]